METIESIALIQLNPLSLNFCPKKNAYEGFKLLGEWEIQQINFQILHFVGFGDYDKVYNKLPLAFTTNWNHISTKQDNFCNKRRPKIIFEMHIPNIQINTSICSSGGQGVTLKKKNQAATKNLLEITIPSLQITFVFGKQFYF